MTAPVVALLVPVIFVSGVDAQKQGAPLWDEVVTVNRVKKVNRQPPRGPKIQKAALLTLQWHLLQQTDSGSAADADASREFQTGDRFRLSVTTNQAGYLYIVNQPEGKDGVLLFPDLRINKGRNNVLKDKEYVIPSYCPDFDDPKDCWFRFQAPAGTETLIIIFSRQRITTLPNQIAKPYAPVKRSKVDQLISSSGQNKTETTGELTIPRQKAVRYATWVQNTNLKDNEELIATIELRHGE